MHWTTGEVLTFPFYDGVSSFKSSSPTEPKLLSYPALKPNILVCSKADYCKLSGQRWI